MKVIGITGGIGSGKSEVLKYLNENHNAIVCKADVVAKNLERKGSICYSVIIEYFGKEILDETGKIDRAKLASIVFSNPEKLELLNKIVHPAVKRRITRLIKAEQEKGTKLFVLEAALLLEDNYDEICDETWYIYARDEVRRKRLKLSRGYSDEKIDSVFRNQLSRDEFLNKCDRAVDNSGAFEETCAQLDSIMSKINAI